MARAYIGYNENWDVERLSFGGHEYVILSEAKDLVLKKADSSVASLIQNDKGAIKNDRFVERISLNPESRESAYELLKRGEDFLKTKNPAQAAVVLERARNQEPGRTSIREALGRAYFNSGRYEKAADEFRVVIDLYPTNGYAHYCLGKCAEKLGDLLLSKRHLSLAQAMGYQR